MRKVRPIVTRWIQPRPGTAARLLGLPEKDEITVEDKQQAFFNVLDAIAPVFDHFEIERWDWPVLACRLAVEGGFIEYKVKGSGPGRKPGGAMRMQWALWANVQLFLRDNPGKRPTHALEHLRKTRGGLWHGKKLKSLQNRYDEARKDKLISKFAVVFAGTPETIYKMAELLAIL